MSALISVVHAVVKLPETTRPDVMSPMRLHFGRLNALNVIPEADLRPSNESSSLKPFTRALSLHYIWK